MSLPLRAWHRVENAAAQTVMALLGALPPRPLLWMGGAAGAIAFVLLRGRRRIATDNVLRSGIRDTEVEARRVARQSFRTFALMIVETLILRRRLTTETWRKHVKLRMEPAAEQLLRDPEQGLIVASCHVGNWEVVARVVARIKPVCAIYQPFRNPYMDASLRKGQVGENVRLIAKYDDDPLRLARSLSQGEVLAIMIDQYARRGLPVEFFGRETKATPAVAMLHLVTRTPILFAYAVRTGPLRFDLHIDGPFSFQRTGDRARDVSTITQSLTEEVETIARAHAEQYMWGHRRWGRRAAAGA